MTVSPVRIVLAGGGTGGHVYPAIAISEIARHCLGSVELLFIGVRGRAEEHIVPAARIPIEYVEGTGLSRSPLAMPGFVSTLSRGWLKARRIMGDFRPHILVSTGGFSSAPAVFAAATMRGAARPALFVHEQNAVPGRMNRVAGRLADRVGVSFEGSSRYFPAGKVVHTGYPVREGIGKGDRAAARRSLNIPDDAFTVLAFGGSGGARSLNRGLALALPDILGPGHVHVIHGTGRYFSADYDPEADTAKLVDSVCLKRDVLSRYHPLPYIEDMAGAYAASDLAVCRTGAGTLAELRAASLPAVLIPKLGLPHEHQLANALEIESSGCGWLIREEDDPHCTGYKRLPHGALSRMVRSMVDEPAHIDDVRRLLAAAEAPDTEAVMAGVLRDLLRHA
ncbi:MAG: UDP-N-acetylglucosamine--N-acetylmuramyl-(pentapeptide) pyrophosphoryl-undecaprenol N-acetylglucosamine transferase [Deltaproteobacteria bacterium]|nr:UDP-N-acetylglucosamine--N-acetylmuramyl-(pentapeptide) pyrophosphoryl-undecaprenol N-acetylglucosamine transferase [Deltaproteobacteria bacterium]